MATICVCSYKHNSSWVATPGSYIHACTNKTHSLANLQYVTVLAKTRYVRTKTEFNFIAAVYRHTQYLSIPSVSSVKC